MTATVEDPQAPARALAPTEVFTIEAAVSGLDTIRDGVIAAVTDPEMGVVRALVVRRGKLGVLGYSWRGGQALWSESLPSPEAGAWSHVAATLGTAGILVLYVDGRALRAFRVGGIVPGRHPQQALSVAAPVVFGEETIAGWQGGLRGLELHDRALKPAEVAERARVALGVPEPAPEPVAPAPAPEPHGCEHNAHQPAWRREGDHMRCLECQPPRGCPSDEHQRYWRPRGDIFANPDAWWQLECSYCLKAACNPTTEPGEAA